MVPKDRLQARAREVAAMILRCAPLALQASKQVMLQSARHPELADAMRAPLPGRAGAQEIHQGHREPGFAGLADGLVDLGVGVGVHRQQGR